MDSTQEKTIVKEFVSFLKRHYVYGEFRCMYAKYVERFNGYGDKFKYKNIKMLCIFYPPSASSCVTEFSILLQRVIYTSSLTIEERIFWYKIIEEWKNEFLKLLKNLEKINQK